MHNENLVKSSHKCSQITKIWNR